VPEKEREREKGKGFRLKLFYGFENYKHQPKIMQTKI
jgi:hypothetical protein